MLNCKEASQLASHSLDEKLPFQKNMALKLHLLLCHSCTYFTQQLLFLRWSVCETRVLDYFCLTTDAKQSISQVLKDKQPS